MYTVYIYCIVVYTIDSIIVHDSKEKKIALSLKIFINISYPAIPLGIGPTAYFRP